MWINKNSLNVHINGSTDAQKVCEAIMDTYKSHQETDFTRKYHSESMHISRSCCGCPLISVEFDNKSLTFHVDYEEEAVLLCNEIMAVYK